MNRFEKVAVIGAGTMGSAIAQHFCMKGLTVTLMDQSAAGVERGMGAIRKSLEEAVDKKVITPESRDRALSRLRGASNRNDLGHQDLVVEAVFENLDVKRALFADLEGVLSDECVLASNTSSFLIADIAQGLRRPERVVGVHYFYHAAKNKLVEIIPGPRTDATIVTKLFNFYAACDKIPIVVKDAPGFAVNRFFVPWLNEAARLLEEGKGNIPFIDEVARRVFEIGMGPFALMNATGVPIAQHAAEGLAEKLGGFYAPAEILRRQVASGKQWVLDDTTVLAGGKNDEQAVTDRLLAASIGIAAQMVAEGVTDAASTDLGARVGLRWAFGPFELARKRGLRDVENAIAAHFRAWDLRCPKLDVPLNWVESRVNGSAGFVVFNLPDRMNPLSEEVVRQLASRWDDLERDPRVKTIWFAGRGKAFVAGADIKFFLDCIERKELDRIQSFTESGQELFSRIASSAKPTVAYLNGLTLGGGLELALACKYRVATPKATFAFPETGIGIYPGLGGTQRTARLVGRGIAKFLVATGQFVDAQTAHRYGLVDDVRSPVTDLAELESVSLPGSNRKPESGLPEETAFAAYDGTTTDGPYERALKRKAPRALKLAMSLVDEGLKGSLADGLRAELRHLKEIFSTQDAKRGLMSVLTKSKPEYTGE